MERMNLDKMRQNVIILVLIAMIAPKSKIHTQFQKRAQEMRISAKKAPGAHILHIGGCAYEDERKDLYVWVRLRKARYSRYQHWGHRLSYSTLSTVSMATWAPSNTN